MTHAFPCPCCGHLTFSEPPGSYAICPVCFWEDDQIQLRWPQWAGGANKPSLIEAQHTYAITGACEARLLRLVRPPADDEPKEPGWRPINLSIDRFEPESVQEAAWPNDKSLLYWWRPTFWRAPTPGNWSESADGPVAQRRWSFVVEHCFHITGRGTVVIGRLVGTLHQVEPAILTVGGISRRLDRIGFELICRRREDPQDSIALVLPGVSADEAPPGATVHSIS